MPATVIVASAIGATTAAAGAAIAGTAITGALLLQAAATAAIAAGIAYMSRPDEPDGGSGASADFRQTVRAAVSPVRWILGRSRVGGAMFYATEDGSDPATLWLVLGIGAGPMDAIERIWLGDEEIEINRTAAGVITPASDSRYAGNLTVWEEFSGDGATDGPGPTALRAGSGGEWTAEHRLNGIGYVVIRLRQPSGAERLYTGIPNLNFLVRGLKVSYPGQAAPIWTENAAALRYWYLRERRGIPAAAFDDASVREAVAVCGASVPVSRPNSAYSKWPSGELRYAINGVVTSGDPVETIETAMDWAWQGHAVEMDGTFHFRPGKDRNSVASIGPGDFVEPGLVYCSPVPSAQSRLNAATMSLRQSSQHDWLEYTVPEVTDAETQARDRRRIAKDLGVRKFIASPSAADRLLRVFLRRARASFRATYRLAPGANLERLSLKPTDIILLSDDTLGLTDWRAMIVSTTLLADWSVEVVLEDCPDQTFADTPGLGQLGRPYVRLPRRNDPPEAIAALSATVSPRVSTDGTIHWKVVVEAPAAPLGFVASLSVAGVVEQEKRTGGASLEFDIDTPRREMTVRAWRETDAGIAGPVSTRAIDPEYSAISIPAPALRKWQGYAGIMRVVLADPASRAIAGAEFRFRSVAADSASDPGTITAERWLDADQLDALRVVLTPGRDAIFNVTFPETAKYRIAARFIDVVGRLGPVTDLGVFLLAVPASAETTLIGAPTWAGTSQFLAAVDHGAEVILLPDRDDIANLPAIEWNGYGAANLPENYERRHRVGSGAFGAWTEIDADETSTTISGLTNGTAIDVEIRRAGGTATRISATPRATATAPPKPTGAALTPSATSIAVSASVVEDSRAPVDRWEYRIRAGSGAFSAWAAFSDTDDPALSAEITGLTVSTAYSVEVRAVNSVGDGAASDTLSTTTLAALAAPPKPTLTLTAPGAGNFLTVAGSVSSNGGSPILRWEIRHATSISGLSAAAWGTIDGASGNSFSSQLRNLNANTLYYVQIRAVNSTGNSPAADRKSATVPSSSPFEGGTGTYSDPWEISVADWATARSILAEVKAKGAGLEHPTLSNGARAYNIFAVLEFDLASARTVTATLTMPSGYANEPLVYLVSGDNTLRALQGDADGDRTVTASASMPAGRSRIFLKTGAGWASGAPANLTQLDLRIATAPAGAGGYSTLPEVLPPTALSARQVGSAGIRAAWNAPEIVASGYELTGYALEYRTSPSGAWTAFGGTLPPDQSELTVPDGVAGDDAWRIRAVYSGGATGTAYSEWAEVSIAEVFAGGGASGSATGDLVLSATTASGEVTVSWTDPSVSPASFWPWGQCEGYGAAFNAATSTWWRTELVDLESAKSVNVSVEIEHYEPPLRAVGSGGGATGAADEAPDAGPVFRSDLGSQVWRAGAAIDDLPLPVADAGGAEVAYRVDGLPRGVYVGADGALTGTPGLAAGSRGVARIAASTPDGLVDHSYFEWTVAAPAAKSGTGAWTDGYALDGSVPEIADVRDWLLPGETNAAALAAASVGDATHAIPSYFSATVPAGERWAFDLWDPDGGGDSEDFDLVDYPASGSADGFHVTTGGRERHIVDNSAGASAVSRRIGVYVHATATDADSVNANEEGAAAKSKVLVAWSPAARTGQDLADEWEGYGAGASAGGFAPGSQSVSDVYIYHGTSAGSLTRIGPISGETALTARYVRAEVHLRKWRGRALRQAVVTIRES